MDEQKLIELINNEDKLNERINFYLNKGILVKQEVIESEILGHIEKAEHNVSFVAEVLEDYSDWAVVGCYYASYHIALALALKKGFSSKNHDATLCILIKYYNKSLSEEDLELLNKIYLSNQDILFYAHSKEEREKASYSTQINFDNQSVSELRKKTLTFVNKCKEILK